MSTSEINLRVTGQSSQGGRRYMEDAFVVAYQQTEDKKDLEYAFFGIFDGHGGREAAQYAKNNLLDNIVTLKQFWLDDDDMVLSAIRDGFLNTHLAMWKEVGFAFSFLSIFTICSCHPPQHTTVDGMEFPGDFRSD
ncbi:protein phosphatase 1D [Trichonephila clavata]|uniref:Protein phosphatase 1D n=1 Tax=Trichonephila clavata TaxID=2740835 RepID=A0A8X6LDA5_TRICU|nr:protein phosphatase 1D [Trichonephila clavata]